MKWTYVREDETYRIVFCFVYTRVRRFSHLMPHCQLEQSTTISGDEPKGAGVCLSTEWTKSPRVCLRDEVGVPGIKLLLIAESLLLWRRQHPALLTTKIVLYFLLLWLYLKQAEREMNTWACRRRQWNGFSTLTEQLWINRMIIYAHKSSLWK